MEHWNKYQKKDLAEVLSKFPDGGKVLDLGAGSGETSNLFSDQWEWIGVDIEPETSIVNHGDAHNLSYPDNHFDVIISIAVFEHLHSPWIAIREISRVLKPGGFFFGTTAFLEPEHANSYFHMTRHGILKLMEEANFTKMYIKPTEGWTVINSMKIFPVPGRKFLSNLRSKFILGLRSFLIKTKIVFSRKDKKEKALNVLNADKYRYAGSFRFLCQNN